MPIVSFDLDYPDFDDMQLVDRSQDELTELILRESAGKNVSMVNYTRNEINQCARKLIIEGYLRGTVFDFNDCAWSRPTSKGRYLLFLLENDESINF
jgi:hypothetical protein